MLTVGSPFNFTEDHVGAGCKRDVGVQRNIFVAPAPAVDVFQFSVCLLLCQKNLYKATLLPAEPVADLRHGKEDFRLLFLNNDFDEAGSASPLVELDALVVEAGMVLADCGSAVVAHVVIVADPELTII